MPRRLSHEEIVALASALAAKLGADYLDDDVEAAQRNLAADDKPPITMAEVASMGGRERARRLSPERRREIARRAALASREARRKRAEARKALKALKRPITASEVGRRSVAKRRAKKAPKTTP